VALDTVPQPKLEELERIGGADLVVGILGADHNLSPENAAGIVRDAVGRLSKAVRAVVVCRQCEEVPPSGTKPAPVSEAPDVVYFSLPAPEPAGPLENLIESYQAVLRIGGKLGATACGVIGSEPRTAGQQPLVYRLVQPLLELGFDLVMPRYSRQKMEGLLNRSILSPLTRALYGERIQNPMGPDFAVSGKLLRRIVEQEERRGSQIHPLASIASTAICGGFQVCESYLGMRVQPATNWADLSTLLTIVLAPVFADVERNAPFWQRIRGSKPVPWFGSPEPLPGETGPVDVQRMIESFQLGTQNLQEVWGGILPPTTLFELKKLARLQPAQFRMPDTLWASIIYDFVLGYRLRTISRDHLLRSMTPLYLGWIASYALEMENAEAAEVDSRLERLSAAFEARKPYLLSRWRWPDRFNP